MTGAVMPQGNEAIAGIQLSLSGLPELAIRFGINLIVVLLLVRWLYYSASRRKDYLFTYILISSVVFLLVFPPRERHAPDRFCPRVIRHFRYNKIQNKPDANKGDDLPIPCHRDISNKCTYHRNRNGGDPVCKLLS